MIKYEDKYINAFTKYDINTKTSIPIVYLASYPFQWILNEITENVYTFYSPYMDGYLCRLSDTINVSIEKTLNDFCYWYVQLDDNIIQSVENESYYLNIDITTTPEWGTNIIANEDSSKFIIQDAVITKDGIPYPMVSAFDYVTEWAVVFYSEFNAYDGDGGNCVIQDPPYLSLDVNDCGVWSPCMKNNPYTIYLNIGQQLLTISPSNNIITNVQLNQCISNKTCAYLSPCMNECSKYTPCMKSTKGYNMYINVDTIEIKQENPLLKGYLVTPDDCNPDNIIVSEFLSCQWTPCLINQSNGNQVTKFYKELFGCDTPPSSLWTIYILNPCQVWINQSSIQII
jgi:hypothetical protein